MQVLRRLFPHRFNRQPYSFELLRSSSASCYEQIPSSTDSPLPRHYSFYDRPTTIREDEDQIEFSRKEIQVLHHFSLAIRRLVAFVFFRPNSTSIVSHFTYSKQRSLGLFWAREYSRYSRGHLKKPESKQAGSMRCVMACCCSLHSSHSHFSIPDPPSDASFIPLSSTFVCPAFLCHAATCACSSSSAQCRISSFIRDSALLVGLLLTHSIFNPFTSLQSHLSSRCSLATALVRGVSVQVLS